MSAQVSQNMHLGVLPPQSLRAADEPSIYMPLLQDWSHELSQCVEASPGNTRKSFGRDDNALGNEPQSNWS